MVVLCSEYAPAAASLLLALIDLKAIVVPLLPLTRSRNPALIDMVDPSMIIDVTEGTDVAFTRRESGEPHELYKKLTDANAPGLVLFTSGSTGLRASRERPEVPILVLTPVVQTARRLALAWGVHCVETEDTTSFLDMVIRASRVAESEEFAKTGDRLVITAGVPFGTPGRTNILRIATVGPEARRPRA